MCINYEYYKYFNIQILDETDNDYKNFMIVINFVQYLYIYISPNKKSSDRLLIAYKKLTKTIWPSILFIKNIDPSCPNQEIDSDDDNIKDYDTTVKFYHSRKIVKTGNQNNAIEVNTRKS